MKKRYCIIWILIILLTACNSGDENVFIHDNSTLKSKSETITFLQDVEDVSVLIFNENSNNFNYLRSIVSGWSTDGKVSTRLELGKYKFLFMKSAGTNTSFYPSPLNSGTSFNDIRIDTKADSQNAGYVLPVDEIWLPETADLAKTTYTIVDETTVKNKLTRAVSQIVLNLKRAAISGTDTTYLSFPTNMDIMDNIKDIRLDISGIGESINIDGGKGSVKTLYDFDESLAIVGEDGFASLTGPLLFPTVDEEKATIKIKITPASTSVFPEMNTTVSGVLERNKKLEITLLITSTYQLIDIIVDTNPITEVSQGDSGIWE